MPIYEYICESCNKKSSVFTRSITEQANPTCPECGGSDLQRCISSFAIHKSVKAVHEESGGPASGFDPSYYSDPRNIGRSTEKMLGNLGIDMNSDEYKNTFSEVRESIAAAREGEMPDSIKDKL